VPHVQTRVRLRATWPLPIAVILVLGGLIYARVGPLSAEIISGLLILGGLGLAAWAFTSRRPG